MGSAHSAGRITVIGAGLAGPLLSILLAERGFHVEIYERRPDMRKAGFIGGRSINLAVSTRGIHALQQAGVWDRMRRIIVPMRGRMMHSIKEELTFQQYGKDETEVINSVSRAELNRELMTAAESRGVTIHFNRRCTGIDTRTGAVRFRDEETRQEMALESDAVIGTDGTASAIRSAMLNTSRFNFSQDYLDYGYKELIIPAGPGGRHLLQEVNALHIWPRGTYMLIALPNIDGTFACILFLPFEGEDSFASLDTEAKVLSFFESRFCGVVPLIPDLTKHFFTNPTGSMVTIRCFPWVIQRHSLLLGDAAHAIVPFFGQGFNCAFEDCTLLMAYLDHRGPDWPRVFDEFQKSRKIDTDAIAEMALENFVEMRDRVADSRFLFKKRVELALEARYPGVFVPKYAMVTFHRVPYSVALARGRIQDIILTQLCDSIDRVEDLDWSKAGQLVSRYLTPLMEAP